MLHDVNIQSPVAPTPPPVDQASIDEVPSPVRFSAQILELRDSELFPEALQKSEVTSSSNCGYEDNSSYATNGSIAQGIDHKINGGSLVTTPATTSTSTNTATSTTTTNSNTNNSTTSNLSSMIFDAQEEMDNDISASIDFSSPSLSVHPFVTGQQEPFDFSSMGPQISLADGHQNNSERILQFTADTVPAALLGSPLASMFEDDCLSSVPSYYVPVNPSSPSCSFLSTGMVAYMANGPINTAVSANSSVMFNPSILLGPELQPKDLEFQVENGGIFCPDLMLREYNRTDIQALTAESQQLVAGPGSATSLTPELSTFEDSTFKVGKLTAEQRKEKIQRYIKKRNQRNFSKKIKYACRKTLADSRPRVRGRFAKNDEFGETHRQANSNREEDDGEVVVKAEDDMVDSSDIFAHINGVNSFKCHYTIQSWI